VRPYNRDKGGNKMAQKTSWLWWLLPILLGIIGGIIGFLFVRGKDSIKARNILIVGAVISALGYLFNYLFLGISPF